MDHSKYYTLNSGKIVFEKFEDETVLVNLERGNYYGVMHVGRSILQLLEYGATESQIITAIAEKYQQNASTIEEEIRTFFQLMANEEIIIETEQTNGFPKNIELVDKKLEYISPTLEVFTDMQDLILLDPIHDVGSQGWPNPKDQDENPTNSKN
jgi:hypothetical protein